MRLTILIGGKAGQGINKLSEIVSKVMSDYGYFTFNYRDYPSLIRGGHNFNVLSISDKRIGSIESKIDIIVALDKKTVEMHKKELKKSGIILSCEEFCDLGLNANIALAGALIKILGVDKKFLIAEVKKQFNSLEASEAAEKGYDSEKEKFNLKKSQNKLMILTGNQGISQGAINSKLDLYFSYPMTPATGVMHELASNQIKNNLLVFQPESEISAVNAALGASFTGSRVMVGTSGGGFDLMTEALSFQGISEIPLTVYLASRPGPGTGVPTYTCQSDLDVALRAGHGEFPRVVIAPGDPIECIEKTNEALYLAEKFKTLSIILSDKHLAEGEFSTNSKPNKILDVKINRAIPGKTIVRASSYEHDEYGNTKEDAETAKIGADNRIKKYRQIKKEVENFEMIKIFGNKNSKNLIIGWGSTKTVVLDAIEGLDCKFLQVLYLKPISDEIRKEIEKSKNVLLVEQNSTGQLGRLIREKTGIKIEEKNRILKYDSRPFYSDELNLEIAKRLK
ncbi:MAG: 2-oxoacid:acceptor oxidoreductase family protein [Candidatus Pacearchaeota archaeon]